MRRHLKLAVPLAVAGLALACGSSDGPRTGGGAAVGTSAQAAASPALQRIRTQVNDLLDGGPRPFRARLAQLKGHPVVYAHAGSYATEAELEDDVRRYARG